MSHKLIVAAILAFVIIMAYAYSKFHATQTVPWTNAHRSGEMRSKLYPSAEYRCCADGNWVCTNRGCGKSKWADAGTCGKMTYGQDSTMTSSCD